MSYPISPDKHIRKLSRLLTRDAETKGIEFSFGGDIVYPLEAFAHFGCLSLFLVEAKEHYEKLYNNLYTTKELVETMGVSPRQLTPEQMQKENDYLKNLPKDKIFPIDFYEKEEDTYFGFIPRPSEDATLDFLMLSHFAHYTVEEYCKIFQQKKAMMLEGRIPLDGLYDKMVQKINAQVIEIKPQLQVSLTNELDVDSSFGQEN